MKTNNHRALTRRRFLRNAALGAGAVWLSPWHRSWAVPTGNAGVLRLLFFTDVHTRTEWETPDALAMAADAMNAQKPDFIIAGGDLITEGYESAAATVAPRWEAYLKMHWSLDGEVHPVVGNHDLVGVTPADGSAPEPDPRRAFRDHFGLDRTFRSLDAAGYHFILLDSLHITDDAHRYHGLIHEEQLTWLAEDLASVPVDTPIVLVTHIPLRSLFARQFADPIPPSRLITNARSVLELFHEHHLLLVLQGHLHVNELIRHEQTVYITGGAVCGRWWRGARHGTREGFGMVTLGQNRVEWEYMEYGWTARRPPHL